ncbi:unnamed protein product [Pleuronectes platessa]|uniref:Uncharacterized protein n=1 Tax=Pleuronectes platessa TaxID=8262 RepID=A0A9N7U3I4_PLEPL|nr:unnamed protein product [Pleuronectes platessa]
MSLHLLLVLIPFTVLAAQYSSIIIRAGAEVTLSCDNMKNYSSLTCKVKHGYKEEKFSFIPPSSGKNEPAPGNNEMTTDWWPYSALVVGFATIVILVVILIRWRRNKATDTQMNADENRTFSVEETRGFDEPDSSLCEADSSVPVVSGNKTQTHKHTVDPAEDVAYASISHSPYSTAQIQGGDDAVTYSTVKAPSSSPGPSADPSSLYATVTLPGFLNFTQRSENRPETQVSTPIELQLSTHRAREASSKSKLYQPSHEGLTKNCNRAVCTTEPQRQEPHNQQDDFTELQTAPSFFLSTDVHATVKEPKPNRDHST